MPDNERTILVESHDGSHADHPDVEAQGGVIRYLRRRVGLTQEELAHALGITVGTVSRWEKGRFRPSRLARTLIMDFARSHNVVLDLKPTSRPH